MGGGGVGEQGITGSAPAGAGEGQPVDQQGGFLLRADCGGVGALPDDPALPQVVEGHRVGTGFGQEVATEAEHVCPAAEFGPAGGLGKVPAGGDEPLRMRAGRIGVQVDGLGGQPAGGVAGGLGGFGGVLGQVAGGGVVGEVLLTGQPQRADVSENVDDGNTDDGSSFGFVVFLGNNLANNFHSVYFISMKRCGKQYCGTGCFGTFDNYRNFNWGGRKKLRNAKI